MMKTFPVISRRNFAEKVNGLCEVTRNLAKLSPRKFAFENFNSRSECKKKKRKKRKTVLGLICTLEGTDLENIDIIKYLGVTITIDLILTVPRRYFCCGSLL